jgi:hypothetical protein
LGPCDLSLLPNLCRVLPARSLRARPAARFVSRNSGPGVRSGHRRRAALTAATHRCTNWIDAPIGHARGATLAFPYARRCGDRRAARHDAIASTINRCERFRPTEARTVGMVVCQARTRARRSRRTQHPERSKGVWRLSTAGVGQEGGTKCIDIQVASACSRCSNVAR